MPLGQCAFKRRLYWLGLHIVKVKFVIKELLNRGSKLGGVWQCNALPYGCCIWLPDMRVGNSTASLSKVKHMQNPMQMNAFAQEWLKSEGSDGAQNGEVGMKALRVGSKCALPVPADVRITCHGPLQALRQLVSYLSSTIYHLLSSSSSILYCL